MTSAKSPISSQAFLRNLGKSAGNTPGNEISKERAAESWVLILAEATASHRKLAVKRGTSVHKLKTCDDLRSRLIRALSYAESRSQSLCNLRRKGICIMLHTQPCHTSRFPCHTSRFLRHVFACRHVQFLFTLVVGIPRSSATVWDTFSK